MTEAEFIAAQAAGQVKTIELPKGEQPAPLLTVDDINKKLETYIAKLEALRKGLIGCKMYLGSTQAPGTSTPYTTLNLDTVEYAEQVTANTTAHSMTLTASGFYLVVFQGDFDGASAGNSIALDVKSGSTQIGYASKKAGGNTDYIGGSFIAKFNGNEVLTMGGYTGTNLLNGAAHTFLSITKLSI